MERMLPIYIYIWTFLYASFSFIFNGLHIDAILIFLTIL